MPTQNSANTYYTLGAARELYKPLQPAFYITAGNALNVTGDGTLYTIAFNTAVFDVNSDFNLGTYTFTAPITGKYFFSFRPNFDNLNNDCTYFESFLVTSNRTISPATFPGKARISTFWSTNGFIIPAIQVVTDLDAADTATFALSASGGTKIADIIGSNCTGWLIG